MKKLIHGIVKFRENLTPEKRETFSRLALGQSPDTLLVTCSDSRVAPNVFASTDPGDLFVVRNVGNLVPRCEENGLTGSDESEAAAIEFAVSLLHITDIIVCGHSECGAMQAILKGRSQVTQPHLQSWLRHGEQALERLRSKGGPDQSLSPHNQLSQLSVLLQLENLMSHPLVAEQVKKGKLRLHGWWFDIAQATVHAYEQENSRFTPIDEAEAQRVLARLNK